MAQRPLQREAAPERTARNDDTTSATQPSQTRIVHGPSSAPGPGAQTSRFHPADARLWRTFEHSPVGVCLCEPQGRALWLNRAFGYMLATPREELLGVKFFDLIDARDAPAVFEAMVQIAAGRHESFELRARLRAGAGQTPEVGVFMSAVRAADEEVAYIVAQTLDVTSQQRTEARFLQRLELEKIAASVATELVNIPLEQLDGGVIEVLGRIAAFVGADRGFVVRAGSDGELDVTHQWARAGERDRAGPSSAAWLAPFFTASPVPAIVTLDDVAQPTATWASAIGSLHGRGIRALLAMPSLRDDKLQGALCFTSEQSRKWESNSVALLRIAAQIIFDLIERKANEAALRESEARFRQLADRIDQIFWMLQLDPLRMIYVSPAAERMWGVSSADVMHFAERVLPEDLETFSEIFAGAMSEAQQREYRIERSDGQRRWLRTRAFPVHTGDGQVYRIAGITEDITESKRIADELVFRAEMDRLTTDLATGFINVSPDRTAECIEEALERLGRFSGADVSFIALLGHDGDTVESTYTWLRDSGSVFRDGAVGWRLSSFPWYSSHMLQREHVYAPSVRELPPAAATDRAACEALGIGSAYAVPMVAADVAIGWLGFVTRNETRWSADALRLLDVAAEMLTSAIERQRAAQALAHHGEFERLIASLSTDFINIPADALDAGIRRTLRELAKVTRDDWAILYVTDEDGSVAVPAYEWRSDGRAGVDVLRPLAVGVEDPLGSALRERGTVDRPAGVAADGDDARLGALGLSTIVYVALVSKGELLGVLAFASLAPKTWPAETIALLRIAGDMLANAIERIRTEKRMRRHEAELAHALRLGTIGELAAGLAHELNQPLAAILGFARGCENRLRNRKIDPAELVATVGKIADQALRAGEVIRTLRAHVRKTEPRREWCDVNELLADVLRLLGDEITRNDVRLVKQLETKLPKVQVDPTQIQQVLLNLLRNAVDAIAGRPGEGGTVIVSTHADRDGEVEISVSDTGGGIAAEAVEQVFEPFYTTKAGGLGLGLSIARSIAEGHHGRLWVAQNEDRGAVFRLRLPSEPSEKGET